MKSKITKMPSFMTQRHKILHEIYSKIEKDKFLVKRLFNFKKTIHADLDLSWIDNHFQEKEVGSPSEYQIVIATIKTGQISDTHIHEVGSSAFIVLGNKTGFSSPTSLVYRTGHLEFPSLKVDLSNEINLNEGDELDIPSYIAHQFENKGSEDAHILIVTHPIISVEEDHEDIYFTKRF